MTKVKWHPIQVKGYVTPTCAWLTQGQANQQLQQPLYPEWSPPRTNSVHTHSTGAEEEVVEKG